MKNEVVIRAACFAAVFVTIAVWERLAQRRPLSTSRTSRWASNLGIMLINPLLVRLLFPVLAVAASIRGRYRESTH